MADDDDVDILGEFSISSCFPGIKNEQISKCQPRQESTSNIIEQGSYQISTSESNFDRDTVDFEHGIHLNFTNGIEDGIEHDENVPHFIQEEILIDSSLPDTIEGVMSLVNTGQPTVSTIVYGSKGKQKRTIKNKISLLKPGILHKTGHTDTMSIESEILYCEDDIIVASTESVGDDDSLDDEVIPNTDSKMTPKAKKPGNHRRKYTTSTSSTGSKSGKSKSKFNISVSMKQKSKLKYREKTKGPKTLTMEALQSSPKMQIVFSSGQALPLSEGEQVIKIEKQKSSDSESDVDIDVDSGDECQTKQQVVREPVERTTNVEFKTTVLERKFEPLRPRQKAVKFGGDGGCTIMHTEDGDLIEVVPEPRRQPRKQPVHLHHCKPFTTNKPAPFGVSMLVSALVLAETHAHGSRAEVMGLLGGELSGDSLTLRDYAVAAAAADCTHCDMDPVSQAQAASTLNAAGHAVVGWHHSHPRFPAQPSELDLRTQRSLQQALERPRAPFVALITSQHWARGRRASHFRCLRVELEGADRRPAGYQFGVTLLPDVTAETAPRLLRRLLDVRAAHDECPYRVDMADTCPDAGVAYVDKCIASVSHHLTAAGYAEQDVVFKQLVGGIRDIFR